MAVIIQEGLQTKLVDTVVERRSILRNVMAAANGGILVAKSVLIVSWFMMAYLIRLEEEDTSQ
jgi:hypothetical protein